MRDVAAAAIDITLIAVAGYLGFRVGVWVSPCGVESGCFALAPLTLGAIVAFIGIYVAGSYLTWHTTLGRRVVKKGGGF